MNIIKTDGSETKEAAIPKPTDGEMQNEYNYILSEKLTRNLLGEGLINEEEFDKIMAKNRKSFSPFISRIMP